MNLQRYKVSYWEDKYIGEGLFTTNFDKSYYIASDKEDAKGMFKKNYSNNKHIMEISQQVFLQDTPFDK